MISESATLTSTEGSKPVQGDERFLFAGHQTFPLRISWLPKAADAIAKKTDPFADPRLGMERLGIGLVCELRSWARTGFEFVMELGDAKGGDLTITGFRLTII